MKSLAFILAALAFASCGSPTGPETTPVEEPDVTSQTNPKFDRPNSVFGNLRSDGAILRQATIEVVGTDLRVEVDGESTYSIVLDSAALGTETHELRFSSPGHVSQTHTVTVPPNKIVNLSVDLARE